MTTAQPYGMSDEEMEAAGISLGSAQPACPTCGVTDPAPMTHCSDGFHAPGETYWPATAQPGQEQRMEREDRIWHVARAISVPEHHTTWDLLTEQQKDLYFMQAEYAIIAMEAARPTADLGEDGELIERLRHHADAHSFFVAALTEHYNRMAEQVGSDPLPERARQSDHAPVMREAADRLILYREALGDAFGTLHYIYETTDDDHEKRAAAEARDKIDAVLSRSGG